MWTFDKLEGHGDTAWRWYSRLPRFMRWQYAPEDEKEFIESFERGINFGGWENGNADLRAIIHGEDKGEILEGHLFCERDADVNLLAAIILFSTLEGLKIKPNILIETPARHRTLRNLLPRLGYHDIGLSVYRGNNTEMAFYLR